MIVYVSHCPSDRGGSRSIARSGTVDHRYRGGLGVGTVIITHAFKFKGPDDDITDLESVLRVTDRFDEHGITYELRGEQAEPAAFILETADEVDADLICVGGRTRSPVGKVLFGSVSQQIILKSDLPVLVAERSTSEAGE